MNPKPLSQQIFLLANEPKFCQWLNTYDFPHTKIVSISKSKLKSILSEKVGDLTNLIILFYLKSQQDEKYIQDLMLRELQKTPNLKFFIVLESLNLKIVLQCLKLGSVSLILRSEFEDDPVNVLNKIQNAPFVLSPKIINALFKRLKQPIDELLQIKKLTPREIQVLDLIAQGLLNREIKTKLEISENTVKSLTYKIYKKLKVNNRVGAVRKYLNV